MQPRWNLPCRHACTTFSRSTHRTPTRTIGERDSKPCSTALPHHAATEAIDKENGEVGRLSGLAAETAMTERGRWSKWGVNTGSLPFVHVRVCDCEEKCKFYKFARFLNLKCINMKDFLYFPSMKLLALLCFRFNPRIYPASDEVDKRHPQDGSYPPTGLLYTRKKSSRAAKLTLDQPASWVLDSLQALWNRMKAIRDATNCHKASLHFLIPIFVSTMREPMRYPTFDPTTCH